MNNSQNDEEWESEHMNKWEQLESLVPYNLERSHSHQSDDDQQQNTCDSRNCHEAQFEVTLMRTEFFVSKDFVDFIDIFFFIKSPNTSSQVANSMDIRIKGDQESWESME